MTTRHQWFFSWLAFASCCCCGPANAAEKETVVILEPVPFQVIQREGFVPQFAHEHHPGGAALGFADVEIRIALPQPARSICEYRIFDRKRPSEDSASWTPLDLKHSQNVATGVARVDAGGWYRLEIRLRHEQEVLSTGSIEPFGVGEVFLIAGQSYATNCNDQPLRVQDPEERIAAFDAKKGHWQVAHDPQPAPDGSDGGSIWPACADLLLTSLRVPVGFVNSAFGGTASSQWLPDGKLHSQLVDTGTSLGRFRAVLWQQGESDVIAGVSTEEYVRNLLLIREMAVTAWGFEPPWLMAKSTLHPTVYNNPAGEARIRQAIDQLCDVPGFVRGPDTDVLGGENRGGPDTRRHFSALGQRNAAAMWFACISHLLSIPRPQHELTLRMLPELHLLKPAWKSAIVHRESSVLLQPDPDLPATARVAFPIADVLKVQSADGQHDFAVGRDFVIADDRCSLIFQNTGPVPSIPMSALFPSQDAPDSYRHRTGHPDQNLLYAPGKWFHERNVEISYLRADAELPASEDAVREPILHLSLPRTRARLKAGYPVTLAVSGDSISTGLDASALSSVSPWQPGYVDLLAAQLQATFGSQIHVTNRAVAGWSVANGVSDLDELLKSAPDLLIVAYGMNDVGRRNPEWFLQQTRQLVERVRSKSPESELILVAPMLGHAEWVHTPREMFALYRDALKSLTDVGIELADVTSVWELMLRRKHDLDLTGNGLNHPNDFGHRLYAQAILSLLVPK